MEIGKQKKQKQDEETERKEGKQSLELSFRKFIFSTSPRQWTEHAIQTNHMGLLWNLNKYLPRANYVFNIQ